MRVCVGGGGTAAAAGADRNWQKQGGGAINPAFGAIGGGQLAAAGAGCGIARSGHWDSSVPQPVLAAASSL